VRNVFICYGAEKKVYFEKILQKNTGFSVRVKGSKGKGSSLDIAPLTILDSGALQPRKWQLIGTGCSTAAQANGCP